jgi:hypothetical protein
MEASFWRPTLQEIATHPSIPTGTIKSFGPFGPKYEVGRALRPLENFDWMVEVTMIESGERAEYRLSKILDDPEAR